jgi:hypothetical protein
MSEVSFLDVDVVEQDSGAESEDRLPPKKQAKNRPRKRP